jgi:hypothetical protein
MSNEERKTQVVWKQYWQETGGMRSIILEANKMGIDGYVITDVRVGDGYSGSTWAEFTCYRQ